MPLPLLATQRTINAIRRADAMALRATARLGDKLGGVSVSGDYYEGYFAVITSGTGVKVVNGAAPTANVCGSFTAGASNISCTATEVAVSRAGVVYIRIYYTTSYQYAFGFAATLPSVTGEIYITLASIAADGTPSQVWTDGAITYLNGSYWL